MTSLSWGKPLAILLWLCVCGAGALHAQVIDGFAWVDMKADTKTFDRVKYLLQGKTYSAIREIGLVGEQALVITSLRKDPIANPMNDSFTAYGVSLHDGSVEELLDGSNLKYIRLAEVL